MLRIDADGAGIQVSRVIDALNYVILNNIKVSNNSYGWYGAYSQAHYDKIKAARDQVGHMFVAAAGNKGANNDLLDANTGYPASYNLTNIIAVAATNRNDGLGTWIGDGPESSAYGLTTVDLGAPGVDILSTMSNDILCCPPPDYLEKSGTSMAAAHVTGVVALLWSKYPTWPWTVVKNRVMRTARAISALNGKCVTGGVVNAFAALNDCNLNGTPDNQETFPDCNANGVRDWCDIADGLSADCEPNGIPDECGPTKCCLAGEQCFTTTPICCTAAGGYAVERCQLCPLAPSP